MLHNDPVLKYELEGMQVSLRYLMKDDIIIPCLCTVHAMYYSARASKLGAYSMHTRV